MSTACWIRGLCALLLGMLLGLPSAQAQSMESVLSPGVLTKAHAKWDDSCRSCHTPFDRKAQERLCVDCHKDVGRDLAERTGLHGRLKVQPCRSCHTEHKGREMNIAPLDKTQFDHAQTDYLLRGRHRDADCVKCHAPGRKYSAAAQDCQACHRKDDVHKGGLGSKCDNCHDEKGWKETRFDHSGTRFPLKGAHGPARCDSCHRTREYKDTPSACIACHRKDDRHKAQYGEKCESCHTEQRWRDITFRHEVDTRYPLREKHRELRCTSCHAGPLYKDRLSTACVDCHRKDDKHMASLGADCAQCHTEKGWRSVQRFDHDRTAFPLLGKHVQAGCKDCHQSLVYREVSSTCFGCHRKDDRHEATLGERCADCHTESNWQAPRFDHGKARFALRGAHAAPALECKSCHTDVRSYRRTPSECVACHRKDDKHEAQLGERCDSCHDEVRWKQSRFDHNKARFSLAGAHGSVGCRDCHQSLRFRDAPRDCLACHRKDDRHKASLGAACESCHNVRAWRLWRFDHDRQTDYLLGTAHAKLPCASCHREPAPPGRKAAPLARACVSCHLKDDVHERNFGPRCEQCHQPSRWSVLSPGAAAGARP